MNFLVLHCPANDMEDFYLRNLFLLLLKNIEKNIGIMVEWSSLLHNFIQQSLNQVLCKFKTCSRCVGDSRWWQSLTMVPAENKAQSLSLVNHNTETIHHHHRHLAPNLFVLLRKAECHCAWIDDHLQYHWCSSIMI